ncbi:hypothetical protein Hanom_Chr16g01440901 [Helianthus anomalus]
MPVVVNRVGNESSSMKEDVPLDNPPPTHPKAVKKMVILPSGRQYKSTKRWLATNTNDRLTDSTDRPVACDVENHSSHADPDDDLVDTPPGKRRKSEEKRIPIRPREQVVSQPYQPFTGARIRPKVSIDNLIHLAQGLNDEQREMVIEIGFGRFSVLKSQVCLQHCHTGDGWLVEITSNLVQHVFGLPRGKIKLVEQKKVIKKKDLVVQEFRNQFKHIDSRRRSPLQHMLYMLDRHDYEQLFVLNFMVVYFSFLGDTTSNNLAWHGDEDPVRGQMVLLVVSC